ncbi:MAG: heme-binding domain-containing protein [Leptospirales bacterium]
MKKNLILKTVLGFLIVTYTIGEMVISRTNPEQKYTGVILDEATDKILKRSCYDCHSHETVYPWYSRVPVFSFLIGMHVNKAREHLNFSKWDSVKDSKKPKIWGEILEEIEEGEMPIGNYLWLHPDAKMQEGDLQTIKDSLEAAGITPEKGHDEDEEHEH